MNRVHIFISTGRFNSFAQLRQFIDMTYTEDGDGIPSPFIREAKLVNYEPGCIEAVISSRGVAVPLTELLASSSWADQWLDFLPAAARADAAVCVYSPNNVLAPKACSIEYIGEFCYVPVQSAALQSSSSGGFVGA